MKNIVLNIELVGSTVFPERYAEYVHKDFKYIYL